MVKLLLQLLVTSLRKLIVKGNVEEEFCHGKAKGLELKQLQIY